MILPCNEYEFTDGYFAARSLVYTNISLREHFATWNILLTEFLLTGMPNISLINTMVRHAHFLNLFEQ